ncbi:NAD(P)-dependent oxidoreductase [Flexivirga endophytica]|uniref:dTDP-4-dehydrorhamnose reductase n=1 Tax=Flexivirga endophytica TaxID=1849103 RepID=A0A916ST29_9MICO|nr:dTDP-4-dehydrorhamnose reductase [Flexivirga endophytica]GGB15058.1 NAD(P)-dependent oxidoreductase [Flexivirga endophytica]GHB65197.1 NAD(P)-dependent oxidoreductase [Flexivirga endophytica]
MRWLVTGGRGMFGTDLVQLLAERGEEVVAVGSAECDVRSLEAVRATLQGFDVVVNAAAWTAVDDAETHEPEAFAINAVGARNVALVAAETDTRMVHISTDYVFDGTATEPYEPDHPQDPRSAYGRSKAAGEWAIRATNPDALIVRTAWLYGEHGPNFVKTMLRLAGERETLKVVDDQIGQPTWTKDLAAYVVELVDGKNPGGYYHGTAAGTTSWHGFAQEIFRLAGLEPSRVEACTSAEFPRPAPRPAYSVLGQVGSDRRPEWSASLKELLESTI